ncbi:hypothetical protein DVH24_014243 [Malus domestica]|uniref:Uncharacterized protein n=1 Tax=Malus domestica TaxID=3750 RepID=A0A498JFT9_MALDO|nr:hypothetical protein DVH24_014243 [Malus domestica]
MTLCGIWITFRHPAIENHEPFNRFRGLAWLLPVSSRQRDLGPPAHCHLVVMNILPTHDVIEQEACLDALNAIMLDSSANQMLKLQTSILSCLDFDAFHGIEEVAKLISKLKCGEFLLLLNGFLFN